jgi:hypothetical protein
MVDWTLAGPVDRRDEVVATAWWNAQLHDDDVAERNNLPDAASRARQLRLFLDGYRLPAGGTRRRDHPDDRVRDPRLCCRATQARITPDSTNPAPLWSLAWHARPEGWMIRHRSLLENAI